MLEPDLLLILNERRGIIQDWVRGAPDLVIEIVSSTTAANDRGPKLKAYARFGVPEYWIVDLEQRAIEVYRRTEQGFGPAQTLHEQDTLVSPLLPGFPSAHETSFHPISGKILALSG